jgi:hypothetical protein
MLKTTVLVGIIGAAAGGGVAVDGEDIGLKLGIVMSICGSLIVASWYMRGLFDRHNRKHDVTDRKIQSLVDAFNRLPCSKGGDAKCLDGWPVDEGSKT